FRARVGDFHCVLRAFRKDAIDRVGLHATGMEFASEMVIKASLHGMRVAEIPIVLKPDGRSRPPQLRTWHDGWRHLRFRLPLSPRWLVPGQGMAALAAAVWSWGRVWFGALDPEVTMREVIPAMVLLALGVQTVFASFFLSILGIPTGRNLIGDRSA